MKKIFFVIIVIITGLTEQGCLNVFQPLITEDEYLSETRLTGNWKAGEKTIIIEEFSQSKLKEIDNISFSKEHRQLTIDQVNDSINRFHKTYVLSYHDAGFIYYYKLNLTKINDELFCQLLPVFFNRNEFADKPMNEENNIGSRYHAFSGQEVFSTYIFASLTFSGNRQMAINFLDGDKITKLVQEKRISLANVFDPLYDNFLVTASSADLKKFVAKYGGDENLYNKAYSFNCSKIN